MVDTKLEQIKALYLQLNESEKISFNKFLEKQENKKYEELKKKREELFNQFEKTGTMAKDYLKNLFQV